MSSPISYRNYNNPRLQTDHHESRLFYHLRQLYGRDASICLNDCKNSKYYFDKEPCTVLEELKEQISHLTIPDYLICVYNHYPVTEKLSAALYLQKLLKYKNTQVFSIADFGALSPILAIEWANDTRNTILCVCLEQIYSPYDSLPRYPLADAFSIIKVSSHVSPLRILAYDYRYIELPFNASITLQDQKIVEETCNMNNEILNQLKFASSKVVNLIQTFSDHYVTEMKRTTKHLFIRPVKMNLSTADLFYALEDLLQSSCDNDEEYILLNFADPRGMIGCILIERLGE
jgi:hypothetical protein